MSNEPDPSKMTIDEAYAFAKVELSSALGQLTKKGVVITGIRYYLSDCRGNPREYLVDVKVRGATFEIPVKVGAAGE